MNGVQALALLGNHSKTNLKIESTSSNSSSSASSFTSILEQMVSGSNVNPSSIKGATEKEQELELQIDLASLNLSEMAMLEENEDILEMLALLPEEVQNDLFEFLKGDLSEASFIELAEGQQALLMLVHSILMPYQQTADKSKPTNMATFVQRNIGIDVNNFETMDDQLTELKMLLEQKKAAGDSFVDIFQKKDATNTIKLPVFQEQPMPMGTQGLNISSTGYELGQPMTKAEQAVIHIGDRLPKEVQQQQFIRQFQTLMQRSVFAQSVEGINTLSIKLFPAHLGRLDIQLTQMDGVITAKILTGSATTRELIEAQISQLRQAFIQQQIHVEKIEIAHQLDQEKNDQSDKKQKENESSQDEQEQELTSFEDLLSEASFNEQI